MPATLEDIPCGSWVIIVALMVQISSLSVFSATCHEETRTVAAVVSVMTVFLTLMGMFILLTKKAIRIAGCIVCGIIICGLGVYLLNRKLHE